MPRLRPKPEAVQGYVLASKRQMTKDREQTTDDRRQKRTLFLISAALVLATLAAYEPIRHNEFVNLDDRVYITTNPYVNNGITPASIVWAFTKSHSFNWHPLTWLSHMLDCELYGLNPTGHHITNLIIHITNTLLLFLLLSKMTNAIWQGAFVAAVFALHPLHVESVAWASERKDVLSGLFWMLTILAYGRYTHRPSIGRYVLVLLSFAMGLMSKPMVVTLPFVLLLLDYWPLERTAEQITENGKQKKASIGKLIIEKIPLFALSAVSCVITYIAQEKGGAMVDLMHRPASKRIIIALNAYFAYIAKMLYPKDLAVLYPVSNVQLNVAAIAVLGALVLLALWQRKKRWLTAGLLWYLGTLVPVIGIVQVGNQIMADRYTYLPSIGLLIIVAWGAGEILNSIPCLKPAIAAAGVTAIIVMVLMTRTQAGYWRNDLSLFGHTLKITKNNAAIEKSYGFALYEAGRDKEAEVHFRNALRINPKYYPAKLNLGYVFIKQGKADQAAVLFNEILRDKPDSAEVYYWLGKALYEQKKYDEAIKKFSKAIELNPNVPDAHYRMGFALLKTGRRKEAVNYLEEALRRNKDQQEAYANLGNAYMQLGKFKEAIANLTEATRIQPNDTGSLNNLAWLLATSSDVSAKDAARSVELAIRACELTKNKDPEVLDTLAATYAAAGRFADAVETSYKAVDIAKATGRKDIINEIEGRIKLYQAGQRYQQK
jgi:tetratricopeptide (TPR) repeat protein